MYCLGPSPPVWLYLKERCPRRRGEPTSMTARRMLNGGLELPKFFKPHGLPHAFGGFGALRQYKNSHELITEADLNKPKLLARIAQTLGINVGTSSE